MEHLHANAAKNITKTWILMGFVLGLLIALGYFLSIAYDNPSIFTGFLFASVMLNIVSYWFSDKIVLRLSAARPASQEEFPLLYNAVEELSKKANLPMPKLYVINDPAPNAFATGRNKDHAAVAATTGILSLLNKEELEGVIAHELSHIGNKDILVSTVVAVLVGSISIAADFAMRNMLYGNRDSENRSGGIASIIGMIFMVLAPIAAMIIQLAISRKRELLADSSGAMLTGKPENLASALTKISAYQRPLINAHAATAHLFISNPLRGKDGMAGFAKLFMTHPPLEERIAALLAKE
jgi:heat shock protein HtpX